MPNYLRIKLTLFRMHLNRNEKPIVPEAGRWSQRGNVFEIAVCKPCLRAISPLGKCAAGAMLLTLFLQMGAMAESAARKPIVVGQSLSLSSSWSDAGIAVRGGALAAVMAANANGGVNGQQIELITLDDNANPIQTTSNIQQLSRSKVVAILNCMGDISCKAAAATAMQLKVPLVGVIAGVVSIQSQFGLVRVRPTYEQEAKILALQMKSMQVNSVALISIEGTEDEPTRTMEAALTKMSIQSTRYRISGNRAAAFDHLLSLLGKGKHEAAFLDVSPSLIDGIESANLGARPEWPPVLLSFGSPSITDFAQIMRPRAVGFTSVAPHPLRVNLPFVQQFERDVEKFSSPYSFRYEGVESYLNTRLLIEALRRIKGRVTPESVSESLASLGLVSIDGWALNLTSGRTYASDYLELGVSTKDGYFRR